MFKKGFSLIELMVAVTIIGLLSVAVVVSYANSRVRTRETIRLQDTVQIADALEAYVAAGNDYPATGAGFDYSVATELTDELVTGGYLKTMPTEPKPAGTNVYCANYFYQSPVRSASAQSLQFKGEPLTGSTTATQRVYYIAFAGEMTGSGNNQNVHPINNNVFASSTLSLTSCDPDRTFGAVLGSFPGS